MTLNSEITLHELAGNKMLFHANLDGRKLKDWVDDNQRLIQAVINESGVILIRGLKRMTSSQFSGILEQLFAGPLLDYTYRSTPRTHLRGNVYTASEYHSELTIVQHNESSYSNCWASRLGFYCQQPSKSGGETPIADSLKVYELIPQEIREEFERKGLRYVRNYGLVDLPWQEVFQTEDKAVVEASCIENNLDFDWTEGGLRTTQLNPAVVIHPKLNKKVWFNQAHLFHVSALPKKVRENLISVYGECNLPRNCTFGDGSYIPDDMIAEILAVYERQMIVFKWEQNDVLLLDNMRFSHGRLPFTGARKVLVGMTGKTGWTECT
ncbi:MULTISPECIES: TauD/TfdA family dioxygenase [Pseudoalteromonas]|uniref:TauD/TfdA family dioxygenase n=1 Tax=Pseudoalteromonas maricaloris TaxID=184924 RepID=A0A8I2H4I0_9GAMM|nr:MULTISPECIES: TauD/TfdA family dioxygenase [Pseudoalteromonas]KID39291.1 hypothetical protein QT15_01420 [Pseudoalteromonas flavipulchra NCIMB 2033 = ATCC BAA-314]MBD0784302.1 TauD/TfdA family dioxygenase [Pseudoalteromonas flavipulchra]MBE0374958.1 hypothetical protein [Pseudoalteromonas flavipulchra NCIMB 2033 = ATCC BAA-314]NLR24342.1 TauD/TfdA family dioxygenase [Pseudoalteromonas maricaloris]QUI61471.1 TauD/TfdA family dioxygenase [Pseudoalteromonas sp. A22]